MSQYYVKPTRSNMCEYCCIAKDKKIEDKDTESECTCRRGFSTTSFVESECCCYRMSRLLPLINIAKSVLVIGHDVLKITGIEFYNIICDHPYWVVKFKDARLHVLVREDELPTQYADDKAQIRYIIGDMSYEESRLCPCIYPECRDCIENERNPLVYLHMKMKKRDVVDCSCGLRH